MNNHEQMEAVVRMQKYIEDNIKKSITLYDIAQAAGYSPWHSARIFKKFTGKAPFDYIRSLRLSKAAMILRDNEKINVLDVAFDFVFDSHEGFTRAFSKEFGINPKRYSKKTPPIQLFIPYYVRDYYKFLEKGDDTMDNKLSPNTVFVQVIERPERKLILRRGIKAKDYFEYCNEVGCDVWGILSSIKEALYEPMGLWLPKNMIEPNTSEYTQGVEVPKDYKGEVPDGYDIIDLEPCKMMIFQGQPFEDEKYDEAIGELWKIIKNYDPTIYGFEWAQNVAPRFQLEPQGYRGYIEGKPVKLISE